MGFKIIIRTDQNCFTGASLLDVLCSQKLVKKVDRRKKEIVDRQINLAIWRNSDIGFAFAFQA